MQEESNSRRSFVRNSLAYGLGMGILGCLACNDFSNEDLKKTARKPVEKAWFTISLAQWSLHKMIQSGKLDNLGFAAFTKSEFGIEAIEYVNTFFTKGTNKAYLKELNQRASDEGVQQVLIMVDGEGDLGNTDAKERKKAIEYHHQWVEAASALGCESIRVNAFGKGSEKDVQNAVIESLGSLAEYALSYKINVVVENHGGYSSDGKWLGEVMRKINMPNCGTLPDFGNFCLRRLNGDRWDGPCVDEYNKYMGVAELMPFAKGVSAKSYAFDAGCNESTIDYGKMMEIVKASKYDGYIGIEYEGNELSEIEGIRKTKDLLSLYNV